MSEERREERKKAMPVIAAKPNKNPSLSVPKLFLLCTLFSILSLALFLFLLFPTATTITLHSSLSPFSSSSTINVYVADLPRSLNYALLHTYWSSFSDSRLPTDADHDTPLSSSPHPTAQFPPYPENPLIKQYSAEYWIMGDLMTPPQHRATSFAKRVLDPRLANVVFVPFFATLSAERDQISVWCSGNNNGESPMEKNNWQRKCNKIEWEEGGSWTWVVGVIEFHGSMDRWKV